MVPKGVRISVLWCYVKEHFVVVWRGCVGGQTVKFMRVLARMVHRHFLSCMVPSFARTGNHGSQASAAGMKNHNFSYKIIEFLLWGWGRIAYDLLGHQLLGWWRPFHLVLISHQTDDSFLPSKEQSVFVNWAAGVLIGSSVWLHRSVSCSLYFLDMLPWRWKLTLMPNRKIWCFIRSTSRSMTMSGKNSSPSPDCWGGGPLPVLGT